MARNSSSRFGHVPPVFRRLAERVDRFSFSFRGRGGSVLHDSVSMSMKGSEVPKVRGSERDAVRCSNEVSRKARLHLRSSLRGLLRTSVISVPVILLGSMFSVGTAQAFVTHEDLSAGSPVSAFTSFSAPLSSRSLSRCRHLVVARGKARGS
jgi:hypothetical protein